MDGQVDPDRRMIIAGFAPDRLFEVLPTTSRAVPDRAICTAMARAAHRTGDPMAAPIEHIVVLMLNRVSFVRT